MNTNPYAAPTAEVADSNEPTASPALWNPNAAVNWSLLFSPAFGAFLQMRNWQALGDEAKAKQSWYWFLATLGLVFAVVVLTVVLPESSPFQKLANRSGIIILIAWYVANGRAQPAYVKERFGTVYPRKGWGKPIGIAFLCLLAFFVALFIIGIVIGVANA